LSMFAGFDDHVLLLPVAVYQDIFLLTVLAWAFWCILGIARDARIRRGISGVGWTLCLLIAFYSTLSGIFYSIVGEFPSYHLLFASNQFRAAEASIRQAVTFAHVAELAVAPAFVIAAAWAVCRFAPAALRRLAAGFYSQRGVELLAVYLVLAHLSAPQEFKYPSATANPELRLASSFMEPKEASALSQSAPSGSSDFLPVADSPDPAISPVLAGIRSRIDRSRPLNIVMVIMESVGTHALQLYGARYQDSPELVRLSQHAAMFTRIYAPEALSSNAMAALFCSIYPPHFWQTITWTAPNLAVPGLATVLAGRGYRRLFLSSNLDTLRADREEEFLLNHGFDQVLSDNSEPPRDDLMIPRALQWIAADRSRPFFVAMWTERTHHPYVADAKDDYGVSDGNLNRYLNAVHSTDAMVGDLANRLDAMGCGDNTLIVIVGDHGDAFREHGNLAHGFTVYDEEVHVPLLLVNRRLFPEPIRIDEIGQQVDLAPTILDVLGYATPGQWQGRGLFAPDRPNRAYLFSSRGSFMFGLVDGDMKYIYDVDGYRTALYDLARDPAESTNLLHDPRYAHDVDEARVRVAAWRDFQNRYLAGLEHPAAEPKQR
jgi:arylsulfatase A-like enzyme